MKNTMFIVLAVILAGAAGFYGGTKYSELQTRNNFAARMEGGSGGAMMRGFGASSSGANMGSRPVSGEIIEVSNNSFTLMLPDKSSKIIFLSAKTEINKAEKGTLVDLEKGKQVAVFGSENTDGTVSATNIQLNFRLSR